MKNMLSQLRICVDSTAEGVFYFIFWTIHGCQRVGGGYRWISHNSVWVENWNFLHNQSSRLLLSFMFLLYLNILNVV